LPKLYGVHAILEGGNVEDEQNGDDGTTLLPPGERPAPGALEALPEGTQVGKYTLESLIARGGFGAVYRATRQDGVRAAVKMLHKNRMSPEIIERFHREVHVMEKLNHPNIVKFYELGLDETGTPYYAMELLEGVPLRQRCAGRRMPADETLEYVEPLVSALEAAHALGVVHRDLKASNVYVAKEDDGSERVVLLDFGIAKLKDGESSSLTTSRHAVGTPSAMAPEQVGRGAITPQTDVYGLGTLVFRMLTGRSPFDEQSTLLLKHLHLNAKTPRPSEFAPVPPRIDAVIVKSMSKAPADRQTSVTEFLEEYRKAVGAEPGPNESVSVPEGEHRAAMALYLHVAVNTDDPCDEMIDDMESVLAIGSDIMLGDDYRQILETNDSILMVRPMEDEDSGTVWRLLGALEAREGKSEHVNFDIFVEKVEGAMVGDTLTNQEAVTCVTAWTQDEPTNSVIGTEASVAALRVAAKRLTGVEGLFRAVAPKP